MKLIGALLLAGAGMLACSDVTTAALEETLHCADRQAIFAGLQTRYPQIGEFLHSP